MPKDQKGCKLDSLYLPSKSVLLGLAAANDENAKMVHCNSTVYEESQEESCIWSHVQNSDEDLQE